jgi:hypothetical protein
MQHKTASVSGTALVCVGLVAVGGCGLELGGGGLLGSNSFVIRGTMTVIENNGVCPVFQADDGFTYHLRQGTGLLNVLFDAVTEIGAVSRLEVSVREDLPVACQVGAVVEVLTVLEVIPPDGSEPPLEPDQPEGEPEPGEPEQDEQQEQQAP